MKHTLLLLLSLAFLAQSGTAQVITFEYRFLAGGNLGGSPFLFTEVEITAEADLSNRTPWVDGWSLEHDTARVEIADIGTFDLLVPTRTVADNIMQAPVLARGAALGSAPLLSGPSDIAFFTWDLTTSIGPIGGAGSITGWGGSDIVTTGGVLQLDPGTMPIFFTATTCSGFGSAYCLGDGSGVSCPCGAFGLSGQGCANTGGSGAQLLGVGDVCVQWDSLRFEVTGVPGSKPGLLIRGDQQVASPVGDGILCTTGASQRSQVQLTVDGGTTFTDFNGQPFSAVSNIGAPTNFQFWYRDPLNTCSGAGFNLSNAWSVTYQP